MTNGVRAFVTNKNPTLFLAHEQQTFYASTCTNAEFYVRDVVTEKLTYITIIPNMYVEKLLSSYKNIVDRK